MDNNDNSDFRLSELFDIGTDNVRDEQEGEAVSQEEARIVYEYSYELRILPKIMMLGDYLPRGRMSAGLTLQLIWMAQSSR